MTPGQTNFITLGVKTQTKTATFTVDLSQASFYAVNATGGAVTVNLPALVDVLVEHEGGVDSTNRFTPMVVVAKIDGSVNAVTLDGSGSETINGATTFALAGQWDTAMCLATSAGWVVVGEAT